MEDNKPLLVMHKRMGALASKERVDMVLTPQFYTLKKEKLPLRFAYEAKRIAPSLFDGILDDNYTYEYFVFKQGELWVFIAYSIDQLTEFLKEKKIAPEQITKLFFAEQIPQVFDKPYILSQKETLALIDETVVVIPRGIAENEIPLVSLDISAKPKKGISIQSAYASFLNFKQAIQISAILSLFALLFVVEGSRYGSNSGGSGAEYEMLIEKHPSLQSQYTRQSVAQKYKKIDQVEREKRELSKVFFGLLFKGVELSDFILDEKGFSANLLVSDPKATAQIEAAAKSAKFSVSKTDKGIKVEGRL